jgi:hypothetical protein
MIPRLTVQQSAVLDRKDIFSAQFTVSNDGPLAVEDVAFTCRADKVEVNNGAGPNIIMSPAASLQSPDFDAPEIQPGEKATIPCFIGFIFSQPTLSRFQATNADIQVAARFRTAYTFWTVRRVFRFVLKRSDDGTPVWFPEALSQRALPK